MLKGWGWHENSSNDLLSFSMIFYIFTLLYWLSWFLIFEKDFYNIAAFKHQSNISMNFVINISFP